MFQYIENEENEYEYVKRQYKGLNNENISIGSISQQVETQKPWNDYFSLSKFMTGENSSTLEPTRFVLNTKKMQLFDNGILHSLSVFKKKAAAVLSDLKMEEVKKIRNGTITKYKGLSYKIFTSPNGPSMTGYSRYSRTFTSLESAIGSEGINFLKGNQVPFVIVWTGYVISDASLNTNADYDFLGRCTNESNMLFLKIDDDSAMGIYNINNNKITKSLFKNKQYPINLVYKSSPYSEKDNIHFNVSNMNSERVYLRYMKENDQLYEPKNYYFGMVQSNTLYRFYTIYDSDTNIILDAYKNSLLNIQPKVVNVKDNYGIQLEATVEDNSGFNNEIFVFLNVLRTNFRTNKQFYVNAYDKKLMFVPYNANFLKLNDSRPYVKAGEFAPPKNLILNEKNSKKTDYKGCRDFCKESNCTSFYSYIESVPYKVKEYNTEKYEVDVSYNTQSLQKERVDISYNSSNFIFDSKNYKYVPTTSTKTIDAWVNKPTIAWKKETRTRQSDTSYNLITKYKNERKCIINNDYNEKNMVPLDKMNSIQPETGIISSDLYIQNKNFNMDPQNMPTYVKSKNNYVFYNINDTKNYTQDYKYVGEMNYPMPIGKPSLQPVQEVTQKQKDMINRLVENKMSNNPVTENFSTIEGFDYDGVNATTNSILNKLSTINQLNVDISSNYHDINRLYSDLSGNCSAASNSNDYKKCIKYKFSTHPHANITKKISDKNDAYHEDLTEVQLQQNNTYVLGAITTASLLIFAIMLARE
jgi:hypothetical protein